MFRRIVAIVFAIVTVSIAFAGCLGQGAPDEATGELNGTVFRLVIADNEIFVDRVGIGHESWVDFQFGANTAGLGVSIERSAWTGLSNISRPESATAITTSPIRTGQEIRICQREDSTAQAVLYITQRDPSGKWRGFISFRLTAPPKCSGSYTDAGTANQSADRPPPGTCYHGSPSSQKGRETVMTRVLHFHC